ncbi:MAG: DUF4922 domain-containing protein [Pseudomonadota bacterium]
MSWDDRLLGRAGPGDALPPLVEVLLQQQRASWPLFRDHEAGLARVQVRRLDYGDSHVLVQSNPARRRSSAARVDTSFVARRPCFLCEDKLPLEERGIAFGDELVVAPNPFPILPGHLSIPARAHGPQALAGRGRALFELARAFGPDYLLLYNGPRCGASAPDHFHFQATLRQDLPAAEEVRRLPAVERMASIDSFGRRALVLRDANPEILAASLEQAVAALGRVLDVEAEPMLNIVVYDDGATLAALLFPRAAHRPACFFAPEEERILISPGALDMAGVVVVAEPEHFDRVDLAVVRQIFEEVSLDAAHFGRWLEVLA